MVYDFALAGQVTSEASGHWRRDANKLRIDVGHWGDAVGDMRKKGPSAQGNQRPRQGELSRSTADEVFDGGGK